MISLDEDYIGWDQSSIVVHGLKVCGGLLCTLANNQLIGAHFTSITSDAEILVGCTWLRHNATNNSPVQRMYFVLNLEEWQTRTDKYANTNTLISELKLMFGYTGQMMVFDKNIVGGSVDVKLSSVSGLYYRVTPNPDPVRNVATTRVRFIKTRRGSATPLVQQLGQGNHMTHKLQTDQSGWTLFTQGQMVAV